MRWPMISFTDHAVGVGRHVTTLSGSDARATAASSTVDSRSMTYGGAECGMSPGTGRLTGSGADIKGKFQRQPWPYRVPLGEELRTSPADVREVIVGQRWRGRSGKVLTIVSRDPVVEVGRG